MGRPASAAGADVVRLRTRRARCGRRAGNLHARCASVHLILHRHVEFERAAIAPGVTEGEGCHVEHVGAVLTRNEAVAQGLGADVEALADDALQRDGGLGAGVEGVAHGIDVDAAYLLTVVAQHDAKAMVAVLGVRRRRHCRRHAGGCAGGRCPCRKADWDWPC